MSTIALSTTYLLIEDCSIGAQETVLTTIKMTIVINLRIQTVVSANSCRSVESHHMLMVIKDI